MFVELLTQITNGVLYAIDHLEKTGSNSHIRGINCHAEREVIIQWPQNWSTSEPRFNIHKGLFTSISPHKFRVFLQQVRQYTRQIGIMQDESKKVSGKSKETLDTFAY